MKLLAQSRFYLSCVYQTFSVSVRELFRDKLFFLGVSMSAVFLLLVVFSAKVSPEDFERIALSLGVAIVHFASVVVSLIGASFVLNREYVKGTSLLWLARPVPRSAILLGKILAVFLVTLFQGSLSTLVVYGVVASDISSTSTLLLMVNTALIFAESLVLISLGVGLGAWFSPATVAILLFAVEGLGNSVSQLRWYFRVDKIQFDGFQNSIQSALISLIPNFESFRFGFGVFYEERFLLQRSVDGLVYSFVAASLAFLLGVWLIEKREDWRA